MKSVWVVVALVIALSGLVFADDKDQKQKTLFDLPNQELNRPTLKPTVVKPNLVEFEIEGVRLKIRRNPNNGQISVGEIRNSQINDPNVTLSGQAKYKAIRMAVAIFKSQEMILKRRQEQKLIEEFVNKSLKKTDRIRGGK